MATTVYPNIGTETTLTLNPDALASGSSRMSTLIDFTSAQGGQTNPPDDAEFAILIQTAAGTLGASPNVTFYAAALATGTTYTDGAAGPDGAFTAPATPLSAILAVVVPSAANTATHLGGIRLAPLFGGALPTKVVIWMTNNTGLALAGTAGNHTSNAVSFRSLQFQAA